MEELRPGVLLREKWRIDRLLGKGGMSSVYEATHRNGMRGAIKVLHRELHHNSTVKKRFLREGYVANKVDHPGSVRVLDDDSTDDGDVFLVMELLEGMTLKQRWIDDDRQMELAVVIDILDQVLDVLEAAHRKGIVHRDLKPDNIFLLANGSAKVLDFGIARIAEAFEGGAGATSSAAMMGTPAFMPPEQALAHWDKVDGRSDLFAVGATAYTMLSGRLIHTGSTVPELLVAAATRQVEPLKKVLPDVDEAFGAVIDRSLRFDISERWPDARAMRLALLDAKSRLVTTRTVRLEVPLDLVAPYVGSAAIARQGAPGPAPTPLVRHVVAPTTDVDAHSPTSLDTPITKTHVIRSESSSAVAAGGFAMVGTPTARGLGPPGAPHGVPPAANETMASGPSDDAASRPPGDATPVRLQAPMHPYDVAQLVGTTPHQRALVPAGRRPAWVFVASAAALLVGAASLWVVLRSPAHVAPSASTSVVSPSSPPSPTAAWPALESSGAAPDVAPVVPSGPVVLPSASASPSAAPAGSAAPGDSAAPRPSASARPSGRPSRSTPPCTRDPITRKCVGK